MKATEQYGKLKILDRCHIFVPKYGTVRLRVLPEISDKKSAQYKDEPVIGRSFPIKTYSHSENRIIGMKVHFVTIEQVDLLNNIKDLRALQSAVYPFDGSLSNPYLPPPICKIMCGDILSAGPLCVVLKDYSVSFPPDVVWDDKTYIPYKFDVDLNWEVVYSHKDLPGSGNILCDFPGNTCNKDLGDFNPPTTPVDGLVPSTTATV